jgi:hypothetical protein
MSKSKSKRPLNDGSLALSGAYEVEHEEERDTSPLRSGRLRPPPRAPRTTPLLTLPPG